MFLIGMVSMRRYERFGMQIMMRDNRWLVLEYFPRASLGRCIYIYTTLNIQIALQP